MSTKRTLEALKNAFNQKTSGDGDQNWKLFYPFWKMPEDTVATVRFLPDLDEDNPLGFLVENMTHDLIVNGSRQRVACLSMYGEECPVCKLSRRYYNEEKDEVMGKRYLRKKGYIGQVIVIDSPIEHDQNQLVKLIEFGPKIFKQIQAAFQSGDLENAPFELKGGYNFRIKKTKSGQYADYGTSSFSPKQSDISDEIIANLKLYDLKEFRAKYIDRATLEAMLIADQTGAAVAPTTLEQPAAGSDEPFVKAPVVASVSALEQATSAAQAAAPTVNKAQSVLDMLRAKARAAQAQRSPE